MAGENVVSIVFEGDTSSMTQAFAKVDGELKAASSSIETGMQRYIRMYPAASAGLSALDKGIGKAQASTVGFSQATAIADSTVISFGKSSTTFGKLSAEMQASIQAASAAQKDYGLSFTRTTGPVKQLTDAQREASVAGEEVGKKIEEVGEKSGRATSGLGAFRGTMRALRFDIFEVVAALGLMVKAVDEAAKAEASQRHARDQGISNVSVIKLEGAAREEKFEPGQYDDAAISLKVAGVAADNLVSDVTELGKASRISGVPFKELVSTAAEMTDEFESGGVPSLSQMTTLTLASSGATQGLTDEYRELSKTLKFTEADWKVEEAAQARTHKQTEEHTSSLDSFAGKTGVAADAFAAFQARTNYTGGVGTGMMGMEVMKQYGEGLKQLSQETGMGTEQIRGYMASGKIGYEDLISASGRYRAHQQEELEYTQKQRDEKLRLDTEAKQRSLGLAALQSVMSQSDWKDKAADLQKLSPEGMEQEMQAQMTGAMKTLGDAIVKWFPEIKIAMMFLAGVEIASRLAALNARFVPGLFNKAAGSGAAAAEGEAVAGTGVLAKLSGAAALGAAFLSIPDSTGKTADYWKEHPDLKAQQDEVDKNKKPFIPEIFGIPLWKAQAPSSVAPGSGVPSGSGVSEGNGMPAEVADPKMHELVGQLLKVFAGT